MEDKVKKLLAIKERIEKGKTRVSKLEGQQEQQLSNLKKEFECDTVEEAEKLLLDFGEELDELEKDFEEDYAKLEKEYPILFT